MLSGLTLRQLESLIANLPRLVEASFSAYEERVGKFEIQADKKMYQEAYYDLFREIFFRIQELKPLTILPLYEKLSYILVKLNFNIELFSGLLLTTQGGFVDFILKVGGRNNQLEQYIDKYISDILEALIERKLFFKGLSADQLVQLVEEYAPSAVVIKDSFTSKTLSGRTIYPLFSKDHYWETQKESYLNDDKGYSTRTITIYNNKVYSLNQNIAVPSIDTFSVDEWGEFKSKFLSRNNTFNNRLRTNLKTYTTSALENAQDINGVISDSKIKQIESDIVYDEKDLTLTFGGIGNKIIKNVLSLKTIINYFGAAENSPVGNVDYIASFCEYLYASSYGRRINNGFSDLRGISLLGNFDALFAYESKTNRIAGLKFLENFKSLRSFKQRITLPNDILFEQSEEGIISSVRYNPIYAKYVSGLQDRYILEIRNPYVEQTNVDLILFGIEKISEIANRLGDTLEAVKQTLDSSGILPGYEGLGPISIQINELSKVFIPNYIFESNYANSKVLPGLNGFTRYLLDSYNRLSNVTISPPLTGQALDFINRWGRLIQSSLESIITDINAIGYSPGQFIPNISFKFSTLEKERLVGQLRSLNFQESEISQFLSVESFEDLLIKFAPISDSADQISFLRAYELSQLVYEFGGESAIDSYINYLYSKDENNLTNLLTTTIKDKTDAAVYNEYRYGKLVGSLINLTFAVDPSQLSLFKTYLSGNNLTLFESISYLLQNKEANLVLDSEKINLLKPLVESLIYGKSPFGFNGPNVDYSVANKESPLALKQLTEILDKNLGNTSTTLIQGLYDKSNGLTPKELITILNTGSFHTDYGQLISGYSGGRLTKVINYAYLSGLLHKLSYYSNSYQVPNFYVSGETTVRLDALVEIIRSLSSIIDLTLTNFSNSLEYNLSQDSVNLYPFENILQTQNKRIEEASKIIKGLVPINGDVSNFGSPVINGEAEIIGAPGIGNSPVPESISKEDSITPEQAIALAPQISSAFSFLSPKNTSGISEKDIINKFVSFIEENKLIVGINSQKVVAEANSNYLDKKEETSKATSGPVASRSIELEPPFSYVAGKSLQDVLIEGEKENLLTEGLLVPFDAIESCKRFGGQNCEERFPTSINTCGDILNKAIYSERDNTTFTPVQNGSILIDRPYGKTEGIKQAEFFIPNGPTNKPRHFDLLGENIKITNNSSPIRPGIFSDPIVFTKDSNEDESLFALYYSSEFGLIEAIKKGWERDDPFKCALLDDPYAYNACMNLLKCKRFKREGGISSLRFCPKTLSGGLLK